MARFTLVLKPNGKALLVTPEDLRPEQMELLRRLWEEWKSDEGRDVLFISGTDVRLVEDIDLNMEEPDGKEEPGGPGQQGDRISRGRRRNAGAGRQE